MVYLTIAYSQTAFELGISCADPTEVVEKAVRYSGRLHSLPVFDLEKTFDSVEYCVFLYHPYRLETNREAWTMFGPKSLSKTVFVPCPGTFHVVNCGR